MKCHTMGGQCSICERYAESASAYCCREDVDDQKECSDSELRVIWTPKASIFTYRLNQQTPPSHNKLQCMQLDEAIPPSVGDILGEEHAEILTPMGKTVLSKDVNKICFDDYAHTVH